MATPIISMESDAANQRLGERAGKRRLCIPVILSTCVAIGVLIGGCGEGSTSSPVAQELNGLLEPSEVTKIIVNTKHYGGGSALVDAELPTTWHRVVLDELVPCEEDKENGSRKFHRDGIVQIQLRDGSVATIEWYAAGMRPLTFSYKDTLLTQAKEYKPGSHGYMLFQDIIYAAFDPQLARFVDKCRRENGLSALPLGEDE